ncbi:MAG TPA: 2-oxoacid:acceptor oxidoreductase family protein [bacterium]|nr:2-oxoacid:acceptor oxidoreductase family protein [bacterium]
MKNLLDQQIRIHGRGGQGVVAMAEILATAFFIDGYQVQAFPSFGVERSGAPIQSFVRISRQEILTREHVYQPDLLLILDFSLISRDNIFSGIKSSTIMIINSNLKSADVLKMIKKFTKLPIGFTLSNIIVIDATKIALDIFEKNIVNTIMLGALVKIPNLLKLSSARQAIREKFSDKGEDIVKKNILAISQVSKI